MGGARAARRSWDGAPDEGREWRTGSLGELGRGRGGAKAEAAVVEAGGGGGTGVARQRETHRERERRGHSTATCDRRWLRERVMGDSARRWEIFSAWDQQQAPASLSAGGCSLLGLAAIGGEAARGETRPPPSSRHPTRLRVPPPSTSARVTPRL